ncbi:MAG: DNA-3-methyladenine glycosylase 2 family protein [Gemmatimonadales bacterium]|nr:DNA-3-methyladenine glycosylase 2 family protein [Gemmatimonadales bacterium]MBA3555774.1 DNA-3-methyladenine glycosylase 2 family protein [Gemmatimonadales bacterium]
MAPLSLGYRTPFEWNAMAAYLAARAIPAVEAVTVEDGAWYWRTLDLDGCRGYIGVGPLGVDTLRLDVSADLLPVLIPLQARVRGLFDLDADPRVIAAHLSRDPVLAPLVARRPGLRVPGAYDGFELALRAVLGQQVSVRGASTLAGRLAQLVGEPLRGVPELLRAHPAPLTRLPVSAERLADTGISSVAGIGLPRARAACVVALARAVSSGELPELTGNGGAVDPANFVQRLTALPGIGAWTAAYILMRALRWPDAFPEGDLGLRKAMGGLSPARLRAAAEPWRPWRAYAAQHLWASLGDGVGTPKSTPTNNSVPNSSHAE